MTRRLQGIMLVVVLSITTPSQAREVAGVNLAESVKLGEANQLILNGAGVRTKFIFSIYAAGLYLPRKATSAEQVLTMSGAKRIHMHFVYDEVAREKLVKGWNTGFANNLDKASHAKVAQRLDQFNSYFVTVKKGDIINLDFKPNKGTEIWINDTLKGTVAGDDFYRALLLVWLGEEPADESLKQGMLGEEGDED